MKTTTRSSKQQRVKFMLPKKPLYYFHADEDFREDRDWGKDKSQEQTVVPSTSHLANRAIV